MQDTMQFIWHNDEDCEVRLNNRWVTNITYDAYGWGGMKEALYALMRVAGLQGAKISVMGEPGV